MRNSSLNFLIFPSKSYHTHQKQRISLGGRHVPAPPSTLRLWLCIFFIKYLTVSEELFPIPFITQYRYSEDLSMNTNDGLRRTPGLRREPVVSVKNPTLIPTSHWKWWSRPCRGTLQSSRYDFVRLFRARNSQLEGRSLPRQGRDHLSQWDVWVSVGFFTETTQDMSNLWIQKYHNSG